MQALLLRATITQPRVDGPSRTPRASHQRLSAPLEQPPGAIPRASWPARRQHCAAARVNAGAARARFAGHAAAEEPKARPWGRPLTASLRVVGREPAERLSLRGVRRWLRGANRAETAAERARIEGHGRARGVGGAGRWRLHPPRCLRTALAGVGRRRQSFL